MAISLRLKDSVVSRLGDIVEKYKLELIEVDNNEVLLKTQAYVLDIFASRDGVSIVYFDRGETLPRGYNVFLFLFKARRDLLVFTGRKNDSNSYGEFIDGELESLSKHLRVAAQDILSGSKEWLNGYLAPPIMPSQTIRRIM